MSLVCCILVRMKVVCWISGMLTCVVLTCMRGDGVAGLILLAIGVLSLICFYLSASRAGIID